MHYFLKDGNSLFGMETREATLLQQNAVTSPVITNSGLWLVVYHNVKLVVRDVDGGGAHDFSYRVGSRELPLVHGKLLEKHIIPLETTQHTQTHGNTQWQNTQLTHIHT